MREAILHLSDAELERLGLADVVEAVRAVGLREVTELVCTGPGGVLLVEVGEPIPPSDLDSFEAIEWWERLAADPEGVTYLCKVRAPGLPSDFPGDEFGLTHDVADVGTEGIDLTVLGTQETISDSVALAGDAGMDLLLKRLTPYRGESAPLDTLTDRQREILETAYSMGYYAVPREATTADVAATVGVDPSTVTEHLQRAERNLLGQLLGEGDG